MSRRGRGRDRGHGLVDKLYWRYHVSLYHCFKKVRGGGFEALCARAPKIAKGQLGGQDCRRPEPRLRCGICDGREMERRDWEESGPTLWRPTEASSER